MTLMCLFRSTWTCLSDFNINFQYTSLALFPPINSCSLKWKKQTNPICPNWESLTTFSSKYTYPIIEIWYLCLWWKPTHRCTKIHQRAPQKLFFFLRNHEKFLISAVPIINAVCANIKHSRYFYLSSQFSSIYSYSNWLYEHVFDIVDTSFS